jgi:hypothetical protein
MIVQLFTIDYYSIQRKCLNGLPECYKLVEMLEGMTNLNNLIEASENEYLGMPFGPA